MTGSVQDYGVAPATVRVISQVRPALTEQIPARVPNTEVIAIADAGEIAPHVEGDVLLVYPWGSANLGEVLRRGMRWIHVLGTGVDAFPFHLLSDQVLTCSRGASAVPIGEWVLGTMLAFEKRLPEAWISEPPAEGWGRGRRGALYGRTLGLVGLGAIGSAVARLALAFGMRVRAHRRTRAPAEIAGVEVVDDLLALVESADHVVLAAPATSATRQLFGREVFAHVRPGAHLVNIARGTLVDQDALRAALDEGRVAMASLDAVDPEPLPAGHWLYTHPRVRLSAHVSWQMPGAADVLIDCFVDNLQRYRAGAPLTGVVDRTEGY
jgi:phosphoglycerate dehydrogenase-like enzyme